MSELTFQVASFTTAQHPNVYAMRRIELLVLQGPRVELTVRWAPQPAIDYRDPSHEAHLDDVRATENELGTTLVAALDTVPGSHRLTLTLAVPPIRFPADRDVLPVTTFAVLTLHRDSREPTGALARYTVVHLHGSAHTVPGHTDGALGHEAV